MPSHRLSLDRFEGDLAVVTLDQERDLILPRCLLPEDTRPGEVLVLGFEEPSPPGGDPRGLVAGLVNWVLDQQIAA